MSPPPFDVVVPTIGRPSLAALLESLARAAGPLPRAVIVVDDRADRSAPLALGELGDFARHVRVVAGAARGPATARNRGWRSATAEWIAFLDDDVVVGTTWRADLVDDLMGCRPEDAGTQGDVRVPLPFDREPTDWERNVARLEGAPYITADCAYRRAALVAVDGFDERFRRAYREDTDLAVRLLARGWDIVRGGRRTTHLVRSADAWVSVRLQAGNRDDVLMRALHGDAWTAEAAVVRVAFREHARAVAFAAAAVAFGGAWLAVTARLAWRRIAPGPRTVREIVTMAATSVALPFAAVASRARAEAALATTLSRTRRLPIAVLFDRDGTLIVDDPDGRAPVRPMPGAREGVARLRAVGIGVGVVTNQHRVGEGSVSLESMAVTHARIDALFGAFDAWCVCAHARADGCACRKPEPGLIRDAARRFGSDPRDCVVVGDIGSDMTAARAAGARAILVPTAMTLRDEIDAAPHVAASIGEAVDRILDGRV